jgi:chromosome segregation ATPase
MRPTALESLRGLQAALAETLIPELTSVHAQDAAQTMTMLLESLAAEADTAVADLTADIAAVERLLENARALVATLPQRNDKRDAIVSEIDGVLREEGDVSLTISSLTAENNRLRAVLEPLLCLLEDLSGEPDSEGADELRREVYGHLRRLAVRGWCFWDVASFRERIVRARAELSA